MKWILSLLVVMLGLVLSLNAVATQHRIFDRKKHRRIVCYYPSRRTNPFNVASCYSGVFKAAPRECRLVSKLGDLHLRFRCKYKPFERRYRVRFRCALLPYSEGKPSHIDLLAKAIGAGWARVYSCTLPQT